MFVLKILYLANAAGLLDVYEKKEVYETILMITGNLFSFFLLIFKKIKSKKIISIDEEENGTVSVDGTLVNFGKLFELYQRDVCPTAKLVFVSFLR